MPDREAIPPVCRLAKDREAAASGDPRTAAVRSARERRRTVGVPRGAARETQDKTGRLEGCEAGGASISYTSECGATFGTKGFCCGIDAEIRRYRKSEAGAQSWLGNCDHDLCVGGYATQRQTQAPPGIYGPPQELTSGALCAMLEKHYRGRRRRGQIGQRNNNHYFVASEHGSEAAPQRGRGEQSAQGFGKAALLPIFSGSSERNKITEVLLR